MPALNQSPIQSLTTIPNFASLEKGRQMLNMEDENQRSSMLIVFPQFGAVDGDGYAALIRANHFMDTVGYVGDLIKWLKDDNLHSKETRGLRRQMADFIPTRNPFTLNFRSFYRHGKDLALQRIVHSVGTNGFQKIISMPFSILSRESMVAVTRPTSLSCRSLLCRDSSWLPSTHLFQVRTGSPDVSSKPLIFKTSWMPTPGAKPGSSLL